MECGARAYTGIYLDDSDLQKITRIKREKRITFKNIGEMCGIEDKGFWSRIMHGKKPIPAYAKKRLVELYEKYGV